MSQLSHKMSLTCPFFLVCYCLLLFVNTMWHKWRVQVQCRLAQWQAYFSNIYILWTSLMNNKPKFEWSLLKPNTFFTTIFTFASLEWWETLRDFRFGRDIWGTALKIPLISELIKTLENIHVLEKNCFERPESSVTSLRINSDCEENISATTLANVFNLHDACTRRKNYRWNFWHDFWSV